MHLNSILASIAETPTFKWEPYSSNDIIVKRFPLDDWHKIASDIESEQEWKDLIQKYPDFIVCMVLKEQPSLNPVAFVYLLPEDFEGKTYSIHGGGWKNPYLYYRAFVFLVEHLLRNGIKLRTAIAKSNQRAHRFVKSIGFKTFRHSEDKDLMYITLKNLKLSRTYKSFVQAST